MLDDDKGQPAILRDGSQKLFQRLQPAGGRTEADDGENICSF